MMRTEYVQTLNGTIVKHYKWYVDANSIADRTKRPEIDRWCLYTFGNWRHDNEVDEGWWLQSQEEHALFVFTWHGE